MLELRPRTPRGASSLCLLEIAAKVSGKVVRKVYNLDAPRGVMGRNSNNDLVREKLGWDYSQTLEEGIAKTYGWISYEISKELNSEEKELVSAT